MNLVLQAGDDGIEERKTKVGNVDNVLKPRPFYDPKSVNDGDPRGPSGKGGM